MGMATVFLLYVFRKFSKRNIVHVDKMGQDRVAKIAYLGQLLERRPVRRLIYSWCDEFETDLKDPGSSDWKEQAQNQEAWQNLVSETNIHFGSLRQRSTKKRKLCTHRYGNLTAITKLG